MAEIISNTRRLTVASGLFAGALGMSFVAPPILEVFTVNNGDVKRYESEQENIIMRLPQPDQIIFHETDAQPISNGALLANARLQYGQLQEKIDGERSIVTDAEDAGKWIKPISAIGFGVTSLVLFGNWVERRYGRRGRWVD